MLHDQSPSAKSHTYFMFSSCFCVLFFTTYSNLLIYNVFYWSIQFFLQNGRSGEEQFDIELPEFDLEDVGAKVR